MNAITINLTLVVDHPNKPSVFIVLCIAHKVTLYCIHNITLAFSLLTHYDTLLCSRLVTGTALRK